MSRHGDVRRRLLRGATALLIAGGLAGPGLAAAQDVAPTAETEIIVSVTNEGSLAVSWVSTDIMFLADGANPSLDASNAAPHITATLAIAIADTRADGNRPGYTIALHASDLVAAGGGTIGAASLQVESITGVPETATGAPIGSTLGGQVILLTVPDGAPAVTATIDLVVGTTLAPDTATGTYTGTFTFDVLASAATAP